MTTEAIAALSRMDPQGLAQQAIAGPTVPPGGPSAGAAFSLNDVARFEAAMSPGGAAVPGASNPAAVAPAHAASATGFFNNEGVRNFFSPLDRINGSTERIMARSLEMAADPDLRPGEMIKMMANVQQFMLEAQLTSSVANRTSDGIQELFRQQS
jgi:hypothetical protein